MKCGLIVFVGTVILIAMATSFAADCGDVNNDGSIDILDIVHLINYKYKAGPEPNCGPETGIVVDIDGNIYQTIEIGNQWWMTENLKVTHFRNGEIIPIVTNDFLWGDISNPAYCEYDNDINNVIPYGRLYNWYAVNDAQNIAPVGWHVPSDAEWQTLVDYLGGRLFAGGKMKETGTIHWLSPNTGATNESGFSALPGGYRSGDGYYLSIGDYALFWSSTDDGGFAWNRMLYCTNSEVSRNSSSMRDGFSVRCVKD